MFPARRPSLMLVLILLAAPLSGDLDAGQSRMEHATSLAQMPGVWASEGYGQVLHIRNGSPMRFDRYEVTRESCLIASSGLLDDYQDSVVNVLRNSDGDRFSFRYAGSITTLVFNRLDSLPPLCEGGGVGSSSDALVNFDVLWHTFDEQYAFFAQRGVDWDSLRNQLRPGLTSASSDVTLFGVLVDLLTPLCDGHVELASDLAGFNSGVNETCQAGNRLFQDIMAEFGQQSEYADPFEYFQQVFRPAVLKNIEDNYLAGNLTAKARDLVYWGELGGGAGYLGILQMTNLAGPNATPVEDLEVLDSVLDQAMAYLAGKRALVIDIRLNTGGYDHVAVALADRFADRPRVAFTKKARWEDGFTAIQTHLTAPPDDHGFSRPIVILTSSLTASAAENFLLAMRELPHVFIIGDTTTGVHSDVLERQLPNGWRFTLSNEVYQAADGTLFEGRGIAPDEAIEVLPAGDRAAGRDAGIEAALDHFAHWPIYPGLSGTWWNPDRNGEGYMIDFLSIGSGRHLFATFYTYDANGNQAYLVGNTDQLTNPLTVDMWLTEGGVFGPDYDSDSQAVVAWGTMTIEFETCTQATVELDPEYPGFEGYSTSIVRLGDSPFERGICPE